MIVMASVIQLLVFKGVGSENPKKLWFVLSSIWNVQQITDDSIKKSILVTTL